MTNTLSNLINQIDFSKDYFEVLGISKNDLLEGKTTAEKISNKKVLESAYRKRIFDVHPDKFSGEEKEQKQSEFKEIVFAHTILSTDVLKKIYLKGELPEAGQRVIVNWENIGIFQKESLENEVGTNLFLKMMSEIKQNHTVSFFPNDEASHNYIWEIEIEGAEKLLALTIVKDSEEVLRLTSGEKLKQSLPFKIYIFFPSAAIVYERDPHQGFFDKEGNLIYILKGKMQNAKTVDIELFEGTSLQDAIDFIESDIFQSQIQEYIDGTLRPFKEEKEEEKKQTVSIKKPEDNEKIKKLKEFLGKS